MKFRISATEFKEIDDNLIRKTIDSAYAEWYYCNDGGIPDPDKTLRLVLKGELLEDYNKSHDLRKVMQYVMDYTCNKGRDIIDFIQHRKTINDMQNTDGTPLSEFELSVIIQYHAWCN